VFTPLSHQHIFHSNTTNVLIFFHRFSTITVSGSKTTLLFPWWRLFVTLNLSSALSLPLSLVVVVVVVVVVTVEILPVVVLVVTARDIVGVVDTVEPI